MRRNPFRLRAAEQLDSEGLFLKFFEPEVLEILQGKPLWDRPLILRSPPGGGKTSVLRLLTPQALGELHRMQHVDDCKALHRRLREMGVMGDNGPEVLGVLLSAARNYAALEDLAAGEHLRSRLFLGLLNSRILLAALSSALRLRGLQYPDGLDRLEIKPPPNTPWVGRIQLPADGRAALDWARELEDRACDALDSLEPVDQLSGIGDDVLWSAQVVQPSCLLCDGRPVAARVLVLVDDIQALTPRQRADLLRVLLQPRMPGVWVSERTEALSPEETLRDAGSSDGRDYSLVQLEQAWTRSRRRVAADLIDRRARASDEIELASFAECLSEAPDDVSAQRAEVAIGLIRQRVESHVAAHPRFEKWLTARRSASTLGLGAAVAWRTLEILIERELSRDQLAFEFNLTEIQLGDREQSSIREAARLFVSKEFGIPYYFGFDALTEAASSNPEQLLWLAGELFEEVTARGVVREPHTLPASRQDRILRQAASHLQRSFPQRVGPATTRFITQLQYFAVEETYRPTAPYAPGVTGVAVSLAERDRFLTGRSTSQREYQELARVLSTAVAQHVLETQPVRCKGTDWLVFYLNRLLCVGAGLPLQYGGWRHRTPRQLLEWTGGLAAPRARQASLSLTPDEGP